MSSEGMDIQAPRDYTHVWLLDQLAPELDAYPDVRELIVDTLKRRLYNAENIRPTKNELLHRFFSAKVVDVSLSVRRSRLYQQAEKNLRTVLQITSKFASEIFKDRPVPQDIIGALALIALDVPMMEVNIETKIGRQSQDRLLALDTLVWKYNHFRHTHPDRREKFDLSTSGVDPKSLFVVMVWLNRHLVNAHHHGNISIGYNMHDLVQGCAWPDCRLAHTNAHIAARLPAIVRGQAANISLSA